MVPISSSTSSPSNNFRTNPYEILGVHKSATQKEIQQQYRSLCLKYHPDKNRENNANEETDFAFKEVQHAYSLIGTQEDRRKYDITSRFIPNSIHPDFEQTNNRFANRGNYGPSVYFKFGENGPTFSFYQNGRYQRRNTSPFQSYSPYSSNSKSDDVTPTSTTKRAHFVQHVVVPLEMLYAGGKMNFALSTSIIDRYKAAHRGGFLVPLVAQAALTITMTWLRSQKVNWFISLLMFAVIVHANLPALPMKRSYPTTIHRGWKAGTKIKYKVDEPGCVSDITYIIQEGSHDIYKRVGNDLHCIITPQRLYRLY
jgi:DnaJ-class molecular chaperone